MHTTPWQCAGIRVLTECPHCQVTAPFLVDGRHGNWDDAHAAFDDRQVLTCPVCARRCRIRSIYRAFDAGAGQIDMVEYLDLIPADALNGDLFVGA